MSTDAIDAAKAIDEQLNALKIVDENITEKGEADASKAEEKPRKSPRKFRKPIRHDEERRAEWEEEQKKKEVLETGLKGAVKWYSILGHYGFIEREDGKGDIFVHQSAISKSKTEKYFLRTLADDEPVEFNIVMGRKGPEAACVTGPDGADVRGSKLYRIQLRNRFNRKITLKKIEDKETAGRRRSPKKTDDSTNEQTEKAAGQKKTGKPRRRNHLRRGRKPKTSEGAADGSTSETDAVQKEGASQPKSAIDAAGDVSVGSEAATVAAQI